jgi:hypothetical protein
VKIEVFYDNEDRHPEDLVGELVYRECFSGIINNYPRRKEVPFYSVRLYAGRDRTYRVYVKDNELNNINMTDGTAIMTIKETKDGTVVLQKSTANPSEGAVTDPTHGEVEFYVVPADTVSLEIRQYVFDVTVTVASGKTYTILEGVLNLLEPVNT